MAAYLIGQIEVRDPALWRTYVAGVAESLRGFDAEVLFRGRLARVLAGQQPRSQCVVIRFADAATLDAWFESPDYQQLVPLRDRAADVVISSYIE